jgi:hypothetical protein
MMLHPSELRASEHPIAQFSVEIGAAMIGAALVVGALGVEQSWLDRHFLPIFFVSHRMYVLGEWLARGVVATLGAALALVIRPRLGRLVADRSATALAADGARILLAVTLALGTSELVLRSTLWRSAWQPPAGEEPLAQPDTRLGWIVQPARTGHAAIAGRTIEYAFDDGGYRVRRADAPVDPARPTILFTGESIMGGYGLRFEESVPAQVEALTGVQSANLSVFGYASDQAYLRLAAEMPRFRRPVAVVSLFMPALFERNLDDDRPHLGPALEWLPARHHWRLSALAHWLVPYRSDSAIERGIAMARAVLRATIARAQARGAASLIVVPQFGPEEPIEAALRHRVLDDAGLPYLPVKLDPSWRLSGDSHPDARAAAAIAAAIAERLKGVTEIAGQDAPR